MVEKPVARTLNLPNTPAVDLQQSEELFRQLAANIPEALWVRDVDAATIRYVNPVWEKMTGHALVAGDDLGRMFDAIHRDDVHEVLRKVRERPDGGVDHECRVVRPDGTVRWVHARTFAMTDVDGRICQVAGIMQDITDRREASQRLVELAHYDPLTGLPNRTLLHESLARALAQGKEHGWTVSVLFIDIDHFKNVNDGLGHAAGDELLRQVATRLVRCLRIRDTVGRLGGDEFALVLVTAGTPQAACRVAKKIAGALRQPFVLEGREVSVTASIGIAIDEATSLRPETLIDHADKAMYRAKEAGRDRQMVYATEKPRARAKAVATSAASRPLSRFGTAPRR
jgi:diguanylate cyclase (GGDEF)-like protein/PAS domain S-box-containing protein